MKKWQIVRRMTPKPKGEILKRLGPLRYRLFKATEYHIHKLTGGPSDYILRRCPHCGYIDVWWRDHAAPTGCIECGEFNKVA